jgi:choline dehydrogenase-like flavoprotein
MVRYTLDAADMLRFREGMALVASLHFAAGAKAVVPSIHGLPYLIAPDQLKLIAEGPTDPRNYVAILSHLFGGCGMGADPNRSVCSQTGAVHGVERLYLADASMIPDNIGVNPQHTIMALAMIVVEGILSAILCFLGSAMQTTLMAI